MIKIVKYYAEWCGPCKLLKPVIDAIKQDYPDVELVEIDIDKEVEIAKADGVMSIPTVVIYKDGLEIFRKVGRGIRSEYEKHISKDECEDCPVDPQDELNCDSCQ